MGNFGKLAHLRKSATRLAQGRSHLFQVTPRKERDPPCTGKEAAKPANIVISPGARQVAPFPSDPKKERDPLCTGQEAAKAANIVISPSARRVALIWDPGAIGNQFGIEFH